MTWNAQDQLVQLHTPDLSASFTYDPLGRRSRYNNGSTLKTYLYQGQSILSGGHVRYLDGIGIDEHLQVDASTGSRSYLPDHLGSTSLVLDSVNGASKARYDYTSYGQLEGEAENPLTANPYTYTGREDDETGLYYYRARYYDPELEVFISQDPLGDAQRYVSGNPINYVDPMGLMDVLFQFGGAGIPHTAILSEPGISLKQKILGSNTDRYVYDSFPGDGTYGKRSNNYRGHLRDFHLEFGQKGYIVELDPLFTNYLPNLNNFPTYTGLNNCSTYVGGVINSILQKNDQPILEPSEIATPALLFNALQRRGLVKQITEFQNDFKNGPSNIILY